MNRKQKKIVVLEARRFVKRTFKGAIESKGGCLYLACGVVAAAMKHGLRLVPQAGTCYWPRVTDETDNGVESNVFGYEWDPKRLVNKVMVSMDMMPEMHVWAGDPETQEIVDLTTGFFPAQCKKMMGVEWKAPPPPDFFWGPFSELPKLAVYEPNEDATKLAVDLFDKSVGTRKLRI